MRSRRRPPLGSLVWALLGLALLPSVLAGQTPDRLGGPVGPPSSPAPQTVLTLREAVGLALAYHPSIGEAMAEEDAASGILNQAKALRYPSLVTDASLARYEEPMLVAPFHSFDPTTAPSFDQNLLRGNLTLSYSLFDGGARGAKIGRAESGTSMAEAGTTASRMTLTAEVAGAFLEVLSRRELVDAAVTQRTALESEEDRVRQFLAEGTAAQVDLLRIQASLSQAEAVEISLRSSLDVALGRLARLTGLPGREIRDRALAPVALTAPPAADLPDAVTRARGSSPELALAGHQLAGAKDGVREAKANWYPTVSVAGAYYEYATFDGSHALEWQGILQLSYPLFTGGARRAERDKAAAEERRATEALRRTELAVEERVEEALATVAETRAMRDALERAVEQAEEVARIEALALEVGAGVQTDFLRAQAELFQVRASLSETRHGEVLAGIQLARVMGELTPTWLQENTEVVR